VKWNGEQPVPVLSMNTATLKLQTLGKIKIFNGKFFYHDADSNVNGIFENGN
jgi:hypothetical protein